MYLIDYLPLTNAHDFRLDDPMIWGVLPFRYHWDPENNRWSLGSYDICFKNGYI